MFRSKLTTVAMIAGLAAGLAACGGKDPEKGGGSKGMDAKNKDQKTGGMAKGEKKNASSMGESYEGVTCDAQTEGLGWCDDDFDIAFCSEGEWWILDCSEIGGFCGDDGETIDCYQ